MQHWSQFNDSQEKENESLTLTLAYIVVNSYF